MDVFSEIIEECKSTTVNLRTLWTDKVRDPTLIVPISVCCCAVLIWGCFSMTMDSEHIRYIYNAGFSKFWRGHTQKEMMWVNVFREVSGNVYSDSASESFWELVS